MLRRRYIFPLFVFLFLLQYHYYNFYSSKFGQMKQFINLRSSSISLYNQIQKQHPYAELYEISKKVIKNPSISVFFVFTNKTDDTLDYTTTVLMKSKKKYYLSELGIMINYFFYPRKIKYISPQQLNKTKFSKGDIIVSDTDLFGIYKYFNYLKSFKIAEKQYVHTLRWPIKGYFIYEAKDNIL